MSAPYYGKTMDRPYNSPEYVQRPVEQAPTLRYQDGPKSHLPQPSNMVESDSNRSMSSRPPPPYQSRPSKNRPPPGYDVKPGQQISRPTQVPQWPLANSNASPYTHADTHSMAPNFQQSPQRPPRPSPSRIPSMLDQSRPQQPTPVFTSRTVEPNSSLEHTDDFDIISPSASSARQTTSSMGSIPDFPVPLPLSNAGPPRKSTILGPPPSSRRGASSFYSSVSFVSPIPEESPRSRSHKSYASSAAMPESWPANSPNSNTVGYGDAFYEESIPEKSGESITDDYGDESQLVRSASMGKRGKPSLVQKSLVGNVQSGGRPKPAPLQPVSGGDDYASVGTSSSNTIPSVKKPREAYTNAADHDMMPTDAILKAFAAASASNPRDSIQIPEESRQPRRLSAARRPPKLDMDAVRAAEVRGSLTSLPDLILRATRLAAMIEKGRRPASRLDTLEEYFNEKGDDPHRSRLSDMLAAFPPPVHTPRGNHSRESWNRNSTWPTAPGHNKPSNLRSSDDQVTKNGQRRCCGLPVWAFVLLVIVVLGLVAAAIVVPLEFFVFKNLGKKSNPGLSLSQCQKALSCENGGTSVISQNNCSCICANGFTGSTCGNGTAIGCTMTTLVSTDGQLSLNNATLGKAIPRLLVASSQNFSMPLSGTSILAKFNTADLSCIGQNSLVTFDGRSTRLGFANDAVEDLSQTQTSLMLHDEQFLPVSTITFTPAATETATVSSSGSQGEVSKVATPPQRRSTIPEYQQPRDLVSRQSQTGDDPSTTPFVVTEEVLDFSRVAVLYILEQETMDNAVAAQSALQQLFTKVTRSKPQSGAIVSQQDASKLDLNNNNTIDLVGFSLDIGGGPIGHKLVKRGYPISVSEAVIPA